MSESNKNVEIPDLKISEKLHESNPFKQIMYRLENKKENGVFFNVFCWVNCVFIVFFQIVSIFKYGVVASAILPLTLVAVVVLYNSCRFFSYDVNFICLHRKIDLFFLYICGILLFLWLANLFSVTETSYKVFVDYALIVGVLSLFMPVCNKVYFLYQNYRHSYFSNSFGTKMKIVLTVLFLYVSYIVIPLVYNDIFIQNNIVFVSCLIVTVCYFIGALFRILFLVGYVLLRKIALKAQ